MQNEIYIMLNDFSKIVLNKIVKQLIFVQIIYKACGFSKNYKF